MSTFRLNRILNAINVKNTFYGKNDQPRDNTKKSISKLNIEQKIIGNLSLITADAV